MIVTSLLNANLTWKMGKRVLGIAGINAFLALAIGLLFSNIFKAGEHLHNLVTFSLPNTGSTLNLSEANHFTLAHFIEQFAPTSILEPFLQNNVLVIVVYALIFGLVLKKVRIQALGNSVLDEKSPLMMARRLFEKMLGSIVLVVPFAVFAVVGSAVHQYGVEPMQGLFFYIAIALGGLLFHTVFVYGYWLFRYSKLSVKEFFAATKETLAYAFSVNSSLASLPLAVKSLEKLNISPTATALGTGIATNLNNDGIILYEAMGILFLAQAAGIHLTIGQQFTACLISMAAGMGIGGIPEAGFISLSIVAAAVGIPTDLLPLLLTVDWIVARGRSVVNVISDMTVSIVLDRMEKNDSRSAVLLFGFRIEIKSLRIIVVTEEFRVAAPIHQGTKRRFGIFIRNQLR
jgi:Na+/H+-dicarboxylate symporter